ncbi:hypothetical protein GCM10007385_01050 [Tateyamaria omphalii]|uniref:VOC family protein n=1 Tax=Tateyamaria omphalii TaxID=299262 RepID=UPI0016790A2D|nr:VOC family protein [Tateyamaria omphalii]GGX38069.1 hypothetical protein GCM10007385_01050 [Tateyamaria omphalii]
MTHAPLSKPVGINHISIEVGDVAEAVTFYSSIFQIEVVYEDKAGIPRDEMASVELGDQFMVFTRSNRSNRDVDRHFGLVVDDKERVRERLHELKIDLLPLDTLTFLDPWGNRAEIVSYQNITFTKLPGVLRQMGLDGIEKNEKAKVNMAKKGFV